MLFRSLSLPLLLKTEFVLTLWLKNVPQYTTLFTKLVLIDILICSLSGSLQTMAQASGNIKRYQLVVSGILLLNLPVSYILLRSGYPPQATFVVSILASVVALFARLVILKIIVSFPLRYYLRIVITKVIIVFVVGSALPYCISVLLIDSTLSFLIVILLSLISVLTSIWFLGIEPTDKKLLKISVNNILNRLS